MFNLIAENERGEQLVLTQNPAYVITSIEGLDPPDAVLNLYKQAGADGMVFNSATLDARQLIITMAVNGPAEINRRALYRYFQTKKYIRVYYKNDSIDVYADGYTQNMTVAYFEQKQIVQITIICTDPYFHLTTPSITYYNPNDTALFEFPFSIPAAGIPFSEVNTYDMATVYNPGNIDTGMIIRFIASGAVTNPKVSHGESSTFFGVTTSMQSGDIITVDTRTGHKAVTRNRGGVITNLMADRTTGSSWIQCVPGDNTFSITASSGSTDLLVELEVIGDIEGV